MHWTVENGELVNDGHGAYLTTTRTTATSNCCIDYKTVAKADSGIYLRGTPQVQIWDSTDERQVEHRRRQRIRRPVEQQQGAPGKDPLVLADKPFGQWNSSASAVGSRTTVHLNDKLVVDNATMENYWDREHAAASARARSSCRRTAARSAGGTSSSARSPHGRRS